MSKEIHTVRDTPVTLIHHAANGSHQYPPGSIAALVECLSSGAKFIEIDIIPLADGSFALLHDQHLAAATSGKGLASQMSRSQVSSLRYKVDGRISDEPVGFLEDAIDLLRQHPRTLRLQLDLKPFSLLTKSTIQNLLQIINPVLDRIQVTSVADWVLRLTRPGSCSVSTRCSTSTSLKKSHALKTSRPSVWALTACWTITRSQPTSGDRPPSISRHGQRRWRRRRQADANGSSVQRFCRSRWMPASTG